MDLLEKIVLFRLSLRGRRELKGIEFFEDKEVLEAGVLSQDSTGVWIQPMGNDLGSDELPGPAELLKWEYIATATVHAGADAKA